MTIPDRRTVLRSGLAAAALGAVGAATGCTTRPAPSPPAAALPARRHLIGADSGQQPEFWCLFPVTHLRRLASGGNYAQRLRAGLML